MSIKELKKQHENDILIIAVVYTVSILWLLA